MRLFTALALVASLVSSAWAARCLALPEAQAKRALVELLPGTRFVELCASCGDRRPGPVSTVERVSIERHASSWSVSVNGAPKDLAMLFVERAPGRFENVARVAECVADDAPKILRLPRSPALSP